MKTLDRQKPFGEIFGGGGDGRRYEQDGAFFRGDGSLWTPPDQPVAADDAPTGDEAPADKPAGRKK